PNLSPTRESASVLPAPTRPPARRRASPGHQAPRVEEHRAARGLELAAFRSTSPHLTSGPPAHLAPCPFETLNRQGRDAPRPQTTSIAPQSSHRTGARLRT